MTIRARFDFSHMMARASTWLAMLSGSATASLGAYALMPERVQGLFPDAALVSLGGLAVGAAFLIPVATSFKQRNLGRYSAVEAAQTTTVEGDVTQQDATRIAEAVSGQTP